MAKVISNIAEKISELTTQGNPTIETRMTGCPMAHNKKSLTAGPHGPVALQDVDLLEKITQFTREKIPARNVHALGTGAYGKFTVTNDITKYTSAKVFSKVGKTTELFARMSGIFTEQGDPETLRDPRGFAIKFYTEQGNWDLMAINTPVFNVRDAKAGPDAVHALKRDPRTAMWHPTQTWDFVVNNPESLHQTLMMYTNRGGTPMSFRHMNAWGCHTFSFVNDQLQRFWVKFHLIAELGAKGFTMNEAKMVAAEDPNFLSRDLHQAIEKGVFPKWKLSCQIMPEAEGYTKAEAFDATKVWKHADYPLIDIGVLELNRNPIDYFSEVEQVAFSPANIVPGISFSPDKLLQGRLLIYDDAQHHRIGPNFKQLPINRPHATEANTMYVGGNQNMEILNKFPHYSGSVFGGLQPDLKYREPGLRVDGPLGYYDYPNEGTDEDFYGQAADFYRILNDVEKTHLAGNIAASLEKVMTTEIVNRAIYHFDKINPLLGSQVGNLLKARTSGTFKKTESEAYVGLTANMLLKQ